MPLQNNIPIPLTTGISEFQSGYIYAQAAGSVGSLPGGDNSAAGIQLRWALSRIVGDSHLPKGNLAQSPPYDTQIGFNKANDFVKVYRAEYKEGNLQKTFPSIVNLLNLPTQIIENANQKEWRYTVNPTTTTSTVVIIRFKDIANYNTVRATYNPAGTSADRENFIRNYTGMLEVESSRKLFFAATVGVKFIDFPNQDTGYIKIEAVTIPDKFSPSEKFIACRKTITGKVMGNPPTGAGGSPARKAARVVCENIEYIRFIYSNAYPVILYIETYEDFIVGTNNASQKWDLVGDFSLSIDDNTVFKRLENLISDPNDPAFVSVYPIDKKWPKFNDTDLLSGAFTVKVQNYIDKWGSNSADPDGLKEAVKSYLTLSKTDELANASLPSSTPTDLANFDISYLTMLKMVSVDYHVARMLGLGHIDTPRGDTKVFVHVAQYYTTKLPSDYPQPGPPVPPLPGNTTLNNMYMTLPTGRNDFRLPPAPVLEPVTYGILDTSSIPPVYITTPHPDGYSLFDQSRFINVNKMPFELDTPFETFFKKDNQFCSCEVTKPILLGIEYRKDGEPNYRKPELSNDPEFKDHSGRPETVPIIEKPNPVFIHQEKEEGIHFYNLYSVNWFSRPSSLGNEQATDFTQFPKKATLLPPLNFNVQLIQKESPLIFTTQKEQTKLNNLSGPDKTLVRVTFDWHHAHNTAYQYASYAQFFFRENAPVNIRGVINTVSNPNAQHEVTVTTQPYTLASTSPAQTVQPNILPADISKYVGGLLTTEDGNSFVISSIASPSNGNNPTFVLKQIRKTQSQPISGNQFSTSQQYDSPVTGAKFMVVENLGDPVNWDSLLNKKVGLVKFSSADTMDVVQSNLGLNDGKYTVKTVIFSSGNSIIAVKEDIPDPTVAGDIHFSKVVRIVNVNVSGQVFTVKGDVTAEIANGDTINVLLSEIGDGQYTVASTALNGTDTDITVFEPIPAGTAFGNVIFTKAVAITGINQTNKEFTVSGDITDELIPSHKEIVTNIDNSTTEYNIGGIVAKATVKEYFDVDATHVQPDPDLQGTGTNIGIPGSKTGIYKITFTNFNLENHPDPSIEWNNGFVRIKDTGVNPEVKVLQVLEIKKDNAGNILSPLQIVALDSTFDVDPNYMPNLGYTPIVTGNNVDVNFHPSYRLYLEKDTGTNVISGNPNNFEGPVILPAPGNNTKQTFMAARSIDTTTVPPTPNPLESYLTTPVILLAREIVAPEQPDPPQGPLFATRPNFYGKGTYTFDVKVKTTVGNTTQPRKPFALIFYRANERKILDTLYDPDTIKNVILPGLAALPNPDINFTTRWNELANVVIDSNGLFNDYDGFRFPIPDNKDYKIPVPPTVKPFNTPPADLNATLSYSDGIVNITNRPYVDIVKEAIRSAFLALTENPIIYQFVKIDPSIQPSPKEPVIRNANGDLISPFDPSYDPFPMAVKFAKIPPNDTFTTAPSTVNNPGLNDKVFVRFSDYSLDGAAKNFYFYYAVEMSNNFEIGDPSLIVGPVQLVNASPADAPEIKKVISVLANPVANIPTSIDFEINDYIPSEGIEKIEIYRAINMFDATSVRTMDLAKVVDIGDPVSDDFSDVLFPLFGETLFYRLVALRKIKNEQNNDELVPSLPSNLALTNVVDTVNPPAPKIKSENGNTTPTLLQNVILKWAPTCYNGTYFLQKQNASGNWVEIYKTKTNNTVVQYPPLDQNNQPDFANFPETSSLPRFDADGNPIFHRFRVQVENSSGLLNLEDKELTLAKGCTDLQEIDNIVSYTDSNHTINPLTSGDVDEGSSQPGFMTFTDISVPLPAGHNNFVKTDITVTDDLGNTATKTINSTGGSVTFNQGDGGLQLDNTNPNRTYTIKTVLFTDYCSAGATRLYTLKYISGPCNDLKQLTALVSLADNTHTINPLESGNINDGAAQPVFLTFTDVSNPGSLGQAFDHMDVKVEDDLGNSFTKTIATAAGSVTFNQGDGGLELDNTNPNRTYSITVTLFTGQCSAGTSYQYQVAYTFTPCDQLSGLTNVLSYTDNQQTINPLLMNSVNQGNSFPGTMTFTDITGTLPSGHTFDHMDVIVEDDLGGAFLKTIASAGGSVTFNNGDGGLVMDNSNPQRTYTVTAILFTNLCTNGSVFIFTIKYV
jgi:hypothetical protein